ncbi:MAG: hypothetical protein IJN66_06015 [Muribaculaceae bacterium]|nr:hypothetical protein [Muribaculaceae bacterium]
MGPILITPHVINTIKSLPLDEQTAITGALVEELILDSHSKKALSPVQEMLYSIIKFYIKQDSTKFISSHCIHK